MIATETERRFLSLLGGYLLSLPFDLKALQEAVADDNLDRAARELAAGAIVHTLLPQEGGEGPLRFADDVLFVRVAFREVAARGGDSAAAFRDRFREIFDPLDADLVVLEKQLGADLWQWLSGKVAGFARLPFKGKRASQYVDDDDAQSLLYDEGLEFETNYNVTEEQVKNRLRRADQVVELLGKRRADEARKKG